MCPGYGQEDAADHQVEAGEVVMEIANRALGMQGTDLEEKESEYRRMIFTLDAASADRGVAPELVLRGCVFLGEHSVANHVKDSKRQVGCGGVAGV